MIATRKSDFEDFLQPSEAQAFIKLSAKTREIEQSFDLVLTSAYWF